MAVVGDNGCGKSTLLRLMTGSLLPSAGEILASSKPYFVPQQIGLNGLSVGQALEVSEKVDALHAILAGTTQTLHYEDLNNDWEIEARCQASLHEWGLKNLELSFPIDTLSGGEKTKLFLAGIQIHQPKILLLDEPTNHLDSSHRQKLYQLIRNSKATIVVVSHDISLLNLLDSTAELSPNGLRSYGGNYDFYRQQKDLEENALEEQSNNELSTLRLARKKAQEVRERQEKRANQGHKNKDLYPRILQKEQKNKGENTSAKLRHKQEEDLRQKQENLNEIRQKLGEYKRLKIDFETPKTIPGKRLIQLEQVNFVYENQQNLWHTSIDLEIRCGDRLHLQGNNGSGKTSLFKLLTGAHSPSSGKISAQAFSFHYLDQEYSLLNPSLNILEQAQQCNALHRPDHEVKRQLARSLFTPEQWTQSCQHLSGGERLRLALCCLYLINPKPDLFFLDEPTNNLDIRSLQILLNTFKNYSGTLLVITHDALFAQEICPTKTLDLTPYFLKQGKLFFTSS